MATTAVSLSADAGHLQAEVQMALEDRANVGLPVVVYVHPLETAFNGLSTRFTFDVTFKGNAGPVPLLEVDNSRSLLGNATAVIT
eukprot:10175-Eustigmatos_ZCMA.PRE.1